MFAQVIPAKRGKVSLPFFDYKVPEQLEKTLMVGQLVKIPLRKSLELGIIKSLSSTPEVALKNLKEIDSIYIEHPLLSPDTLNFLEEISVLYHCSLGSLVKSNLPPLQKRKLSKINNSLFPTISKSPSKPISKVYSSFKEKIQYIKENVSKDGQTLIIVPEVQDIQRIANYFDEEVVQISSYLSVKDYFSAWFKIWKGEIKIIIGTRRALFLSFHKLTTIILDNDAHPSHKSWDSAPRFNARDAALIAIKHYGVQLHVINFNPSVESYFFSKENIFRINGALVSEIKKTPQIIDFRAEARAKNFSPLSIPLQEELQESKTSVFLYCNRRGSNAFCMCRDCGNVNTCPNCKRPLVYHESQGLLLCHHCNVKQPMNPVCGVCGGINLARYGAGVEEVYKHVRKLLPRDQREIVQIEGSETMLSKISFDREQIIIGTQLAWNYINWEKLGLMAFIDADIPLYVPEFRSVENAWQLLCDASYRLPKNCSFLVQTNKPEHLVYSSLYDPKEFFEKELELRKTFGYPPFQYLLKLFYGGDSKPAASREAQNLKNTLAQLTKGRSDIKISAPLEMLPSISRGKYWQVIIIKLPYSNYKQLSRMILKIVPEDWKVDPNPLTLLTL